MRINIVGETHLGRTKAELAAVSQQLALLNAQLAQTAMTSAGGSAAGFQQMAAGATAASAAFNAALASSGKFRVEQLNVNDAVNRHTELLQRQDLSFKKVYGRKNRELMRSVYREQIALQHAQQQIMTGGIGEGRMRSTMMIPNDVNESWRTFSSRVGFAGYQLASASRQLLNWGKNTQWAGRQLMVGLTMPVAAFGAAAGIMAYQVDKQMVRIQKVYDTTADANSKMADDMAAVERELAQVREDATNTAVAAAHRYGAAITETLEVQAELAAVGQKGAALQENTNEIMRISMLGEIDHAVTTQALIGLQNTLNLSTTETANAFNYLNSIENATSLSMADFAEAIPRAAGPIKEMGGTIQDLGILLVAMKSRGIEATEGANAIKAMMQRLYRPSKQIREEWQQLANVDPLAIVQEEGGRIMDILPRIADAVTGLNRASRVKLLSGLFGTYQVTRMNAMLAGIQDLEKGVGQVSRAAEVGEAGWEQWASTAEREQQRIAESISGRFKRALEGLKAEISKIGDPFLEVANIALNVFTKMAKSFNSMPDFAKKFIIFGAILVAVSAPVIMLVGLLANFVAQTLLLTAQLLKLASGFELVSRSQWAARASAKLAEAGFVSEGMAAQAAEARVKALVVALQQYAATNARIIGAPAPFVAPGTTPMAPAVVGGRARYPAGDPSGRGGQYMPTAEAERRQAAIAQSAATTAQNTERTSRAMAGAAASGSVMAASMITMQLSSKESVDNAAMWALLLATTIPLMKGLGGATKWAAAHAAAHARSLRTAAVASGGLAKGAGAVLRTLGAMIGPVGLVVAGLTTAGFVIYKLWKNAKEEAKRQKDQLNALNSSTEVWAKTLGLVTKEYQGISAAIDKVEGQEIEQQVKAFQESKEGKLITDAYKEADELEQSAIALQTYLKILNTTNGTATDARRALEVLFRSAGAGAMEAEYQVNKFVGSLDTSNSKNLGKLFAMQLEMLRNGTLEGQAEEVGTEIGVTLTDAIVKAKTPADKFQILKDFEDTAEATGQEFNRKLWAELENGLEGAASAGVVGFSNLGIETGEEFSRFVQDAKDYNASLISIEELTARWGVDISTMQQAVHEYNVESGIVYKDQQQAIQKTWQYLTDQLGLEQQINSAAEARESILWKLDAVNRKTAPALVKELEARFKIKQSLDQMLGAEAETNYQLKLRAINTVRAALGMRDAQSVTEGLKNTTAEAAEEADNIGKNLKKIPDVLGIRLQFTGQDYVDILRQGMQGLQQQMAESASAAFDRRMNTALDSAQSSWDARIQAQERAQEAAANSMERRHERASNALANRHERQSDAMENRQERELERFENRWERRTKQVENYWDARVENVQRAIEAEQRAEEIRQRIFDAEQARLQRLAETANRTIDFNVALRTGDLDEAARIRNDMEAQVQDWALGDAAESSKRGSDRRIHRLEERQEVLEEMRDQALEALRKREEDERKSLERRQKQEQKFLENRQEAAERAMERNQEAEKRHLARVQEMRADALRRQSEADINSMRRRWEHDRDILDSRLELFQSYTGRNQKDLEAWMKKVGLSYDDFGISVKAKGDAWSRYFKSSLSRHIRQAASEIRSDRMWEAFGSATARKTLQGMGFASMGQFRNFMKTGNLPKAKNKGYGYKDPIETSHSGAWVGSGNNNRKGVARTHRGLHQSEVMVRARKGEFLVNERAAAQNPDLLESINKGTYRQAAQGAGSGPAVPGFAGYVGAAMGKMFAEGVGAGMNAKYVDKVKEMARQASIMGSFISARPGKYGDISFSAGQLRNAKIIADVGKSLGMSARDIQIGIMTAITESMLKNVQYGDRDSLGLFQQRPSQGWGTPAQVTDPVYAATKFFNVLKGIKGRDDMTPWMAAQSVQRSAFSDGSNYRDKWDEAQAIFKKMNYVGAVAGGQWGNYNLPGVKPWVLEAANFLGGKYGIKTILGVGQRSNYSEHPLGRALDFMVSDDRGTALANDVVRMHRALDAYYVIWRQRINSFDSRGWRGMEDRGSPTANHMDHVHVSFDPTGRVGDLPRPTGSRRRSAGGDPMGGLRPGERVGDGARYPSEVRFGSPAYWKLLPKILAWHRKHGQEGGQEVGGDIPKPDDNPLPTTGKGMKLRLGTWNVGPGKSPRTKSGIGRMMSLADVLALTEYNGSKRQLNGWMGSQGWRVFGKGGKGRDSVVAWNTRKFDFMGGDDLRMNAPDADARRRGGGSHYSSHWAVYARLREKQSKRDFYQVAAHTIPHSRWHRPAVEVQIEQYKRLRALQESLGRSGAPVFLSGDFNPGRLGTQGLQNLTGMRSKRGRGLDHILFDPGSAQQLGMRTIQGLIERFHPGLLAQFNIPSLSKGAENIKWDNTLVNLHKKETVLTEDLSEKFKRGVDNFASGGQTVYDVDVNIMEPGASAEEITRSVIKALDRREARKPGRRTA